MTPEQDDYLRRNFSGDIEGAVADDTLMPRLPSGLREPRLGRYVPQREPPRVLPQFERVMAAPVADSADGRGRTVAPSLPTRAFLLDATEHAERWLQDANDIASDVKLGIATSSHQATRLMLEAIPVVEQLVKGKPDGNVPMVR